MESLREGWELAYNALSILVGAGPLGERLERAGLELRLIDPLTQVPGLLRGECRRLQAELDKPNTLGEEETVALADRILAFSIKVAEMYHDARRA